VALGKGAILGALLVLAVGSAADSPKFDAGMVLYRAGNCAAALEQFEASEKAAEPAAGRSLYQGICLAKQNNWAAAAAHLVPYTAIHAADAKGWYWLAQSHLYGRDFERAKGEIERAIQLDGQSADNYRTLGEIELERKNYQAAYSAWIKSNQLAPGDARTTYYLGRLFFEADFLEEAAAWLRQTLKAEPHHFAAMTYLGMCAERLGMEKTAIDLYVAAIRESKEQKKPYSWAFLSYAKLLRQSGDEQKAVAALVEAERLCPEAHALTQLGQILSASEPARAVTVLRRAIAMDSSIPDAHYRLSLLLQKEGQTAEAQSEMKNFQAAKAAEERNKISVQAVRKDIR
jgi:tetratricopeptide (TPR) repeat protein